MPDPHPLIAPLPLLLAWAWHARSGQPCPADVPGGLARAAGGLAKLLLLAGPLEPVLELCLQALPAAHTAWAAWMGLLAFAGQLWLLLSGALDVAIGLGRACGRELPEMLGNPFWADGFTAFWSRWGRVLGGGSASAGALAACTLVLLSVVLGRGWSPAMAVWLGGHSLLLLVERRGGGRSLWPARLPRPLRIGLTAALVSLSFVLLYRPDLPAVAEDWRKMFLQPPETLYSVFLNQRLMSPGVCTLLWLAFLTTVALPRLPVLLALPGWPRRPLRLALLLAGLAALGQVWPGGLPAAVRERLVAARLRLLGEGSEGVLAGRDGWLYPLAELDRLTRRRTQPGLQPRILDLHRHVQDRGAASLVVIVPDKLSLYPAPVLPAKYEAPVRPPGQAPALAELRAAGVALLDLTEPFWLQLNRRPAYFRQDRHWTPEAMKEAAWLTSRWVRTTWSQVVRDETPLIDATVLERQGVGDLARALLPQTAAAHWPPETAQLVGLRGLGDGREAPVLLIGDGLLRVFDAPELSFGPAPGEAVETGWPVQLGALLGRPLDTAGSSAEPAELAARAAGKKLVIWLVPAGEL